MVGEVDIEKTFHDWSAEADGQLERLADMLVRQANDAGGHDNVSVLLVRPC